MGFSAVHWATGATQAGAFAAKTLQAEIGSWIKCIAASPGRIFIFFIFQIAIRSPAMHRQSIPS
jgi:hypothetical protein